MFKTALEPAGLKNQLSGSQYRRQHCRKGEGGIPEIFSRTEGRALVVPILNKAVQILKKPPEYSTQGKQQQAIPGCAD